MCCRGCLARAFILQKTAPPRIFFTVVGTSTNEKNLKTCSTNDRLMSQSPPRVVAIAWQWPFSPLKNTYSPDHLLGLLEPQGNNKKIKTKKTATVRHINETQKTSTTPKSSDPPHSDSHPCVRVPAQSPYRALWSPHRLPRIAWSSTFRLSCSSVSNIEYKQ